ncbi:MAG: DUF3445 domain-containing protein [Pseudomonadota bacterium]
MSLRTKCELLNTFNPVTKAPIICQSNLPIMPWLEPRGLSLPGLSPVPHSDRIIVDDAYDKQMAYRDQLIETRREAVYQIRPEAASHAEALLSELLNLLDARPDYVVSDGQVKRPDGVIIDLASDEPLILAAQLLQEDLALLIKDGDRHILVGGVLCFPAHWRLSEKIGRTLTGLHQPVDAYDEAIGQRVERVFNMLRSEQPLMRANALIYTNPDLHQPFEEINRKQLDQGAPRYVRVERQTLTRLEATGGIVFSIHTYLVQADSLPENAYQSLLETRPKLAATDG